ncbi:MAG: hypothetical protein DRR16_11335 [Candidatus Parabeggiatoa sp. nov. 3]|nr:MAG: hypothetical protein DRR00_16875 [Gammaproteobacteria bacterium]RKZ63276.1 MAG: hypothetical protein DRQ99_17390 [Gammaproteobacteria bacterium]RKZ85757.1 MAG: hypothetical protein DRR16_11335 [Gammaproteobacteria bacterium]
MALFGKHRLRTLFKCLKSLWMDTRMSGDKAFKVKRFKPVKKLVIYKLHGAMVLIWELFLRSIFHSRDAMPRVSFSERRFASLNDALKSWFYVNLI